MKEHPIIFSGPMVKAILEGRKTQTRRLNGLKKVNEQPDNFEFIEQDRHGYFVFRKYLDRDRDAYYDRFTRCPYGQVGDRLWVREAFTKIEGTGQGDWNLMYKADPTVDPYGLAKWKPSIHMPRWASRITLEITGVKVERIQEIQDTPTDALKEGIKLKQPYVHADLKVVADFKELWDSINAKRGYGWDVNPWDWALTFKVANA